MTPGPLSNRLEAHVLATEPDPAGWLSALRRVCEEVGLRPSSVLELPGTLRSISFDVARAAINNDDGALLERWLEERAI